MGEVNSKAPDLQEQVLAIIGEIAYATVSTMSARGPWNSPVYFASDEQLNIYWGSYHQSQHSQNIRANGKVFIVIYDSRATPGTGVGLYIEASCVELSGQHEIRTALTRLEQRRHPIPYWTFPDVSQGPIRLYQARPMGIWLNGAAQAEGIYVDARVGIEQYK